MSRPLVLTVYALTFALGLPANALALTALAGHRCGRRRPAGGRSAAAASELLLLNLAAADLLLLLALPCKMAEAAAGMAWPLPAALCPLVNFCFYSSIYLSGLFLAALSVRRYLAVARPLSPAGHGSSGRVLAVSGLLWLLACGHCSVVIVAELTGRGDGGGGAGGLADQQVGLGDPEVGPLDPKIGLGDPKIGLGDPKVGHGGPRIGLLDPEVSLGDPEAGLADPVTDPAGHKVGPVDLVDPKTFQRFGHVALNALRLQVNPADPVTFGPVDPKADLTHPETNHADPKADPTDLTDPKTPNHLDPRTSNPKLPKNPKSPNPEFSKTLSPIDPTDPTDPIDPTDPTDPKTIPKPPKPLKLLGPKTNPNLSGAPNPKLPKADPKLPKPLSPFDPTDHTDPTDPRADPKLPKPLSPFDPSGPTDPRTDPTDHSDPRTNPKLPKPLSPFDPSGPTDPRTDPTDHSDPKTNSKPPKPLGPFDPTDPRTNPKLPKPLSAFDPFDPTDPKPDPKLPQPPNPAPPGPAPYHCYDDFSAAQLRFVLPLRLEFFFVLFLAPFSVTAFCHAGLVRALLARPGLPAAKRRRAVGLAVASTLIFGLCFAPYNLSHLVGFWQGRSPGWRVYATLLSGLNAALDPLVFYFSSGAVRRALSGAGARLRGCLGRLRGQ